MTTSEREPAPLAGAPRFAAPGDHDAVELGQQLTPHFDACGLVTAVVQDAQTGEILMLAHMNAEALAQTIETGIATYWSRSRAKLWVKGETSGNVQRVSELRIDCDQDAVLLKVTVDGHGASCHRGYRSCFYRTIELGRPVAVGARLAIVEEAPAFDPASVYGTPHGH
ncbi:phosphoribosyl-AMP cyclohydrolase [Telmatospirillum sp.]|uniref:phosphoribosyl-AMP cyclohydrolase n=1 Tax=Telmatospirillum sp. TaxID=2079197 RepID=UPI00284B01C2|nr:phosphoribosyl-AMP cyclohydrolase [Telmatospirillum sp.]MDR3436035.1 phosphoribosyl-AMP cyclohydrolase [Telmatospirillum sp.]